MVNAVKPGYVNPLIMAKQGRQKNHFQADTAKKVEKRQKSLEAERQSIQNSLLLMKGSSGDSGASKENIELLEKKLEEVTAQVKAGRQELVVNPQADEKEVQESSMDVIKNRKSAENLESSFEKNNFDTYSKTEPEEADGQYRILKDDDARYKIEYRGIDDH